MRAIGSVLLFATAVVAGAVTPVYYPTLPCSVAPVYANNLSYYGCGGVWYTQTYVNGSTTYVVSEAPN